MRRLFRTRRLAREAETLADDRKRRDCLPLARSRRRPKALTRRLRLAEMDDHLIVGLC